MLSIRKLLSEINLISEKVISVRVSTGSGRIIKTQAKEVSIPDYPNSRFLSAPSYDSNGELNNYEVAVYEYSSGWVVGRGKTVKNAVLDAVDRIGRNGGEQGLISAVSSKKVLNK